MVFLKAGIWYKYKGLRNKDHKAAWNTSLQRKLMVFLKAGIWYKYKGLRNKDHRAASEAKI